MFGSVRFVIEQEFFFFFYKSKDFLYIVILTLHNSKTACDRRKKIVDLESTSKNTLIKKE